MSMGPNGGYPPIPYRVPPQCPVCGLDVVYGQPFATVVQKLAVFTLHQRCVPSGSTKS